jgi:hypothetical protein
MKIQPANSCSLSQYIHGKFIIWLLKRQDKKGKQQEKRFYFLKRHAFFKYLAFLWAHKKSPNPCELGLFLAITSVVFHFWAITFASLVPGPKTMNPNLSLRGGVVENWVIGLRINTARGNLARLLRLYYFFIQKVDEFSNRLAMTNGVHNLSSPLAQKLSYFLHSH